MTQDQNEYKAVVQNLKDMMREQKITHRELAHGIGMSESGVKKVLGASDGSFQRLLEICRYLGVELSDLLAEGKVRDVQFTEPQQSLFLKSMNLFRYYWMLVYERAPLAEAQKYLKLSYPEVIEFQKKLEQAGLIRILPGGRVRLPSIKAVRWVGGGPLVRKLYSEWTAKFIESVANPDLPDGKMFLIRYFKMKPKTYRDLIEAQRAIEKEFVRRSVHEMRAGTSDLQHVRWMAAIDDESFISS